MTTNIYVAYHQTAPRLAGDCITPIHVGRAVAAAPLPHMIGDDTGDNISEHNASWCELTALYWIWKNDHTSDHMGLMHYRRLLDLTDIAPGKLIETRLTQFDPVKWGADADAWLARHMDDYDIVVTGRHTMGRTVRDNYLNGHAPGDWDVMAGIVAERHPDYKSSFDAVARDTTIRLGNMTIMSRAMLDRYCTWLFDILFAVQAADIDRDWYSVQQTRYLGFLAERLMTVFIHHLQTLEPGVRIHEVGILNIADAAGLTLVDPLDAPDARTVNIALSADRAYLPHAAAMLQSVMDHADPERTINVYFLHDGIAKRDLDALDMMLRDRPDTALFAVNTAGRFDASYRSSSRAPSNATYNRFMLFHLLPGLERVLYLDCDMIVRADICDLYDTDMGDDWIGAVPDWIMTRTLTGPIPTIDPEWPDLRDYHEQTLGLSKTEIAGYFNAGVLLFNFAAMGDLAAVGDALLKDAQDGRFLFRDQDILNRFFKSRYRQIDPRWNVFNSTDASYGKVPKVNFDRAMDARRDPFIVHFADGAFKPWNRTSVPRAGEYWSALIRTPFYGEVLRNLAPPLRQRITQTDSMAVHTGKALAQRFPALRGPLLRAYAMVRRS